MLNSYNQDNIIAIRNRTKDLQNVNTRNVTSLMKNILSKKSKCTLQDEKLRLLRIKLDSTIESFNATYKELVTLEIKAMNLNIAAEAIKERDDLVNRIYETVMKEVNKEICK